MKEWGSETFYGPSFPYKDTLGRLVLGVKLSDVTNIAMKNM